MAEYKDNSLWLTFRLAEMDFCILSDYIESIFVPDKIYPMPNSSPYFAGFMKHGKLQLGILELREVFGKMNLHDYVEQFGTMKDMHVSWVKELETYVEQGGEFTKTVDPHKCKFGIWYDGFKTDNARLNRLLKRISVPHERIHQCGEEIVALRARGEDDPEQVYTILEEARCICEEDMIPLLDRLIDIYRSANRGIVLVLTIDGHQFGLLVDEVKALIPCGKTVRQTAKKNLNQSHFINHLVVEGENTMMEVDAESLLDLNEQEMQQVAESQ